MQTYYDGTKLLSMKDVNGDKPEIYICTTNRTGGKTVYFSRLLVNRFLDKGEKFCLLYRFKYELDNCADKFFKDIGGLFFKGMEMTDESFASGTCRELFLDEHPCGYAISINSADNIKKYSHLLSDSCRMLFDEFQSETNHYCSNEIQKFISIHTSIARGNGEQVRYLPVYMIANPVSIINPYYCELGISSRLRDDTKFLRGEGFVMEQGFIQSASDAQKSSAFNLAFKDNAYIAYSAENVYLNDNLAFVEKPSGKGRYLCTIKYMGCEYAVREYIEKGILYVDNNVDVTFKQRITTTTEDHKINYVMLRRNDLFIMSLRKFFEYGAFRFKDLKCKEALMRTISY